MKRLKHIFIFVLAVTFQLSLHGQGSGKPTGTAERSGAVIATISFDEQCPSRQEHILAHPDQFKVLESGIVEVYDVEGSGSSEAGASQSGSPVRLLVYGLQESRNEVVVNLFIHPEGVSDAEGKQIARIPGNSVSGFVDRIQSLSGKNGFRSVEIDPTYSVIKMVVDGISTEQMFLGLKTSMEASQ